MRNTWTRAWLATFIVLVGAAAIARSRHDTLIKVEEPVMDWLLDGTDTSGWARADVLGDPWLVYPGIVVLAFIAFWFSRAVAVTIVLTMLFGVVTAMVTKNIVGRPRPEVFEGVTSSSFPSVFVVQAGPEVKNFDNIKVGDSVVIRYVEALTLELKKGTGTVRERIEREGTAVAKPGERPGVATGRTVTVEPRTYDAGTEQNIEDPDWWVPPCGGNGENLHTAEDGVITAHPGLSGFDALDFAAGERLLSVEITRVG